MKIYTSILKSGLCNNMHVLRKGDSV